MAPAAGRIRQIVASVALVLLALSPLLIVIGANIGWHPLPHVVLARSSIFVIALVSTLIWIGQRLTGYRLAELPDWGVGLLSLLAITWAGVAAWPALANPRAPADAYEAADAIVARTLNMPRRALSPPDRDIYLIVIDSLGRPDVLRSRYGLDVSDVVAGLEARGFTVATRSRSAYPYTFQSLASTLNFAYLDELVATISPSTRDLYPLQYLIHRNALFRLARAAGYRVVMIGSDYSTTDQAPGADVCLCRQPFPHQVEHTALSFIPLLSRLPIDRWAYDAHRAHLLRVLTDLRRYQSPGPHFVMAHLLAPHPPFVFAAEGPHTPAGRFSFVPPKDQQTRRREYRGQAQFVVRQIIAVVDALLTRKPTPVILIQGDHGPDSNRLSGDLDEEFGIFFASLFPDRTVRLPDDVSPLNAARALATRFMGVDLEALPQHQWHADARLPYAMTRAELPKH